MKDSAKVPGRARPSLKSCLFMKLTPGSVQRTPPPCTRLVICLLGCGEVRRSRRCSVLSNFFSFANLQGFYQYALELLATNGGKFDWMNS